MNEIDFARHVLIQEANAILGSVHLIDSEFVKAIDFIHQALDNNSYVFTTGVGKSGIVAQLIASKLSSTGTSAHFIHPTEAMHGDLGRIRDGDVLVVLSHSGTTKELMELTNHLRNRRKIASGLNPIILIASHRHNYIYADAVITYGNVKESCPLGVTPSSSCAAMMAIGDAITFTVMSRSGFNKRDLGNIHPAGTIGKQLIDNPALLQ